MLGDASAASAVFHIFFLANSIRVGHLPSLSLSSVKSMELEIVPFRKRGKNNSESKNQ